MGAPSTGGGVTGVVLAPPSRLFQSNPVRAAPRPRRGSRRRAAVHRTAARTAAAARRHDQAGRRTWRREGTQLHGDRIVATGRGATPAHVDVELRPLDALVERGALIVLLDLAIVSVLWLAARHRRRRGGALASRAPPHAGPQLSRAALARAVRVFRHSRTGIRDLVVRAAGGRRARNRGPCWSGETLRSHRAAGAGALARLADESERLETPLFVFRGGELRQTSDQLYDDLAPTGRLLAPDLELDARGARRGNRPPSSTSVGDAPMLFGYRSLDRDAGAGGGDRRTGARDRRSARPPPPRPRRARAVRHGARRARRVLAERRGGAPARASRSARCARRRSRSPAEAASPPLESEPDGRVPPRVRRVPSHDVGSEREPLRARGGAATYGGRAAQRGERRGRRRPPSGASRWPIRAPNSCWASRCRSGRRLDETAHADARAPR